MDITEAIIPQNLYFPSIKKYVRKEVKGYDTFQHTKLSNIKYGELPAKEDK